MDALPTPAIREHDAAARKPLNPLAMEFVPAGAAPRRALNPFATEFVPRRALLNPLAVEFVPRRALLNPLATQYFVPAGALNPFATQFVQPAPAPALNPFATQFVQPAGALNPLAMEFVPGMALGANIVPTLNPFASEFVPWWCQLGGGPNVVTPAEFYFQPPGPVVVGYPVGGTATGRPSRSGVTSYSQQGRTRFSHQDRRTHENEFARRTIYVTHIDPNATEEVIAKLFQYCGVIVDCRLFRDSRTDFHSAFIEFQSHDDASIALHLDGVIIGDYPVNVVPSRTRIMPVKPSFLPRSGGEKDMCSRTLYCTNIEKKVTAADLTEFCEEFFGPVSRVKLICDDNHVTAMAFIEFTEVSGAVAALSSVGIYAGDLRIRVSPSKTPIRNDI